MRNVKRLIFRIASDLSLVACVALIILWGRSTQHRDEYRFTRHGRVFALASVDGRVVIDNWPQIIEFGERKQRQEVRLLGPRVGGSYDVPRQNLGRLSALGARKPPPLTSNTLFFYWIGVVITAILPALRFVRRFRRELQVYRQYRPAARLRCWKCGYDLTGNTSGTCPECGAPIPK